MMKSLICRGCLNAVASTGLELVDKFCYLGDMLSVDGDANAAVETRIQSKWSQILPFGSIAYNMDISLIMRGRLYISCVQSSMLHRSETWPVMKENEVALRWAEMRMVRLMCDIHIKVKESSEWRVQRKTRNR